MKAFRSELRKIRTVRATWILTLIGLLLVGLGGGATLFSSLSGVRFSGADGEIAQAIDQVGGSAMIVLIVALMSMTTEFRHGTIGRTLQITPSRTRMLAAKLAGGAAYALLFFVLGLVVITALLLLAVVLRDVSLDPGSDTVTALWQGPVGLVLNAIFGIAIGALIRSQAVAITVTLIWLFVVENLLSALVPAVARWLPFRALSSLFIPAEMAAQSGGMLLAPLVALAVFLGYVAVASAAAVVLMKVRDV